MWQIGSELIHCLYFKSNVTFVLRCSCIILEISVMKIKKKKRMTEVEHGLKELSLLKNQYYIQVQGDKLS